MFAALGWLMGDDMEMAAELGRLADASEKLLARLERLDREQRDEQLRRDWGPSMTKVDIPLFLRSRSLPGLAALFDRIVPSEFVAQTDEGELTIACPCGEEPVIRRQLVNCQCGRWFLRDGFHVRVALSPKDATGSAEADPS